MNIPGDVMGKNVLTIRTLGEDNCWLLVQQAMGMPDAKTQSDFMKDKVALLMFTMQSLPERLCVTAAVRQMSGTTIYEGDPSGNWRQEVTSFQEHMLPIFGYYLDCLYLYGFPVTNWAIHDEELSFPVINAGSPDAHPAHVLADLACMLKATPGRSMLNAAWIGCINGTLHSLIEATRWFPIMLRIALPPHIDASMLKDRAAEINTSITFTNDVKEAVKEADYIFAGCRGGLNEQELSAWTIDGRLMGQAKPDAHLLLSASPLRAIPVDPQILSGKYSMLLRQAEYRLRIHKRILHLVCR